MRALTMPRRSNADGSCHACAQNSSGALSTTSFITKKVRVCRTPGPRTDAPHPADSAVAGSVLTGALLNRAGRSPSTLDNYLNAAPEPAHA